MKRRHPRFTVQHSTLGSYVVFRLQVEHSKDEQENCGLLYMSAAAWQSFGPRLAQIVDEMSKHRESAADKLADENHHRPKSRFGRHRSKHDPPELEPRAPLR